MDKDIIVLERLPYPYAHYSDTFIGFHERLGSHLTFCSCQKPAIQSHLEMCKVFEEASKRHEKLTWHANPYADYPRALLKVASRLSPSPTHALPFFIRYADRLCHRCNKRIPYGSYAFSDAPSNYFISRFRPYVKQACYEIGLLPSGSLVLPDRCPDTVKEMSEADRQAYAENKAREAFCFPPIGVNRNQESELFLLVRQVLPDSEVVQHFRADWLDGLELDIFIKDPPIGIEFQGIQHSEPMDHLGGEAALRKTKRRDKRKAALCKANGVALLYVEEGEEITEATVRRVLRPVAKTVSLFQPQTVERPPFDFFLTVPDGRLRWTHFYDRGELSVTGDIASAHFHASGTDFEIGIRHRAERVTSLTLHMHKFPGTTLQVPIPEGHPQIVDCHPHGKPMLEFFRIWAMFDSRISVEEEKEQAQQPPGTLRG